MRVDSSALTEKKERKVDFFCIISESAVICVSDGAERATSDVDCTGSWATRARWKMGLSRSTQKGQKANSLSSCLLRAKSWFHGRSTFMY